MSGSPQQLPFFPRRIKDGPTMASRPNQIIPIDRPSSTPPEKGAAFDGGIDVPRRTTSLRRKPIPKHILMPNRSIPSSHPFASAVQSPVSPEDVSPGQLKFEDELFFASPSRPRSVGPVPPLRRGLTPGPASTSSLKSSTEAESSKMADAERERKRLFKVREEEMRMREEELRQREEMFRREQELRSREDALREREERLRMMEQASMTPRIEPSSPSFQLVTPATPALQHDYGTYPGPLARAQSPQYALSTSSHAHHGHTSRAQSPHAASPSASSHRDHKDFAPSDRPQVFQTSTLPQSYLSQREINYNRSLPSLPPPSRSNLGLGVRQSSDEDRTPQTPRTTSSSVKASHEISAEIHRLKVKIGARKQKRAELTRNKPSLHGAIEVEADTEFSVDGLPTKEQLWEAATYFVKDEDGNLVCFGDLLPSYDGGKEASHLKGGGEKPQVPITKTIVFFIRHFWCGQCQDYTFASLSLLDAEAIAKAGIRVVVVSNGSWKIIKAYQRILGCPFPIYVDGPRKLYHLLGMTKMTNDFGPMFNGRAAYHQRPVPTQLLHGLSNAFFKFPLADPGKLTQLGGEFIFGPEYGCDFAHRMTTTSDHMEAADVLREAGVDAPTKTDIQQMALADSQQAELERLEAEMQQWREGREAELERMRRRKAERRGVAYDPRYDSRLGLDIDDELGQGGDVDEGPASLPAPQQKVQVSRDADHKTSARDLVESAAISGDLEDKLLQMELEPALSAKAGYGAQGTMPRTSARSTAPGGLDVTVDGVAR